ncbi:MAG: 30S ribosome-binding factor RbfA [Bacillota bacterium]|uniref:30S ribosome-binding factor RbfA n=1 Tax=Desulforudis sp. DRI-14 TaxID=3459793 RepID=UPI003477122D
MGYRPERLAEVVKEELSDLLKQMKDPRLGFITVTGAEVSLDLRHVKVFVSVFGPEEQQSQCMQVLNKAQGYLRTELGRRIRLRHTPELTFKLDHSISEGMRLSALLDELKRERPGGNE